MSTNAKNKITIKDLIAKEIFTLVNEGASTDTCISECYCCDLLSVAMKTLPMDSVWFTVMANINALAVCSLADAACIVFAEGMKLDEAALAKAKEQGITIFYTEDKVFDAAIKVYELL